MVFQTRLTGALSCETPIGAQGPENGGAPEPETRSAEEVLAWSAARLLQSSGIDVWADNQITSGELLPLLEVYAEERGIALSVP